MRLMIGTMIGILVCLIIAAICFVRSRKNKRIKDALARLEIEKNKIDSSPIIPELAKVEAFLSNEKLEKSYNEWKDRLQEIRNVEVPKLSDMILETEYSLQQKDYKSTLYKLAKVEMAVYKVKTNSDFLLGEIKDITNSEERSRVVITKLKVKYRQLYQQFIDRKLEFGIIGDNVQKQFELISAKFEEFENIMDNKDYTEVNGILKNIAALLKHMEIVMDEVPSIVLLGTNVLPKKIEDIEETYNTMVNDNYPLAYLNVEYNIDEANKKINDILIRTQELNLEDSLFELKVLVEYFDSLFNDFEKEKLSRNEFRETKNNFKKRLDKINDILEDMLNSLDDLRSEYNFKEENINVLWDINDKLHEVNEDFNSLDGQTNQNNLSYSKMLDELDILANRLTSLEDSLDSTLDTIGSMRNDEIRAREQLEEIKVILKDSKLKMREYNLPVIPQSYYVELNEASGAIREIVKELDRKPITISILNTRVDTARDLVIKLYTKTCELLKTALLAETILVYSNRYRSSYEGVSNKLNLSEQLFLKGEYKKSLDLTLNILKGVEPDIDERIMRYYELYRGDK